MEDYKFAGLNYKWVNTDMGSGYEFSYGWKVMRYLDLWDCDMDYSDWKQSVWDYAMGRYAQERLDYLRGELREERISYGELVELESLRAWIDDGDVELLEAIGGEEEA